MSELPYSRGQRRGEDSSIAQQDERARTRREGDYQRILRPTKPVEGYHKAEAWTTVRCDTREGGFTVQLPFGHGVMMIAVNQYKGANAINVKPWDEQTIADSSSDLVIVAVDSTAVLNWDEITKDWFIT